MGNPSFDAVREFAEIRKLTNVTGDPGDDVVILVKVGSTYRVLDGIVTNYRSDGGRHVLIENGTEYSVGHESMRKYVRKTSEEATAHEDFLTLEHFRALQEEDKEVSYKVGASVAALMSENGKLKIYHGRVSGSDHTGGTSVYTFVTREGVRMSAEYTHLTHI